MNSRALKCVVAISGLAAAALWIVALLNVSQQSWLRFAELGLLLGVSGLLSVQSGRGGNQWQTLESTLLSAVLILAGPWAAILLSPIAGLGALVRRAPLIKRSFNVVQGILSISAGAALYAACGGPMGFGKPVWLILIAVIAANVGHLISNAVLVALVLRLETGRPPLSFLRQALGVGALTDVGQGSLGMLVAAMWLAGLNVLAGLIVAVPLVIARWAFEQSEVDREARQATLRAFIEVVEAKDLYTRGHSERVSRAAGMLGRELRLAGDRQEALEQAGLLHDVGKVGIPISILRKPGKLTDAEMGTIRLHPARGVELIGDIAFLEEAKRAILHHHEKWDGSGYPAGLSGERIPYFSRIIGIVDAFDCLTTTRAYRAARSVEEALDILVKDKRTHFDPAMVDVFVRVIREQGWTPPTEAQPAIISDQPVVIDHDDIDLSIAPGRE